MAKTQHTNLAQHISQEQLQDGADFQCMPTIYNSESIFYKVDWITCVYQNVTLRELINTFHAHNAQVFEIFGNYDNYIQANYGLQPSFVLSLNNIRFQFPIAEWSTFHREEGNMYDFAFSSVKVDVSGQGLDYLRKNEGMPPTVVELFDIKSERMHIAYHFTRADFAFDFVDNNGTFLQDCFDELFNMGNNQFLNGYIQTANGARKGKKFQVVASSGMTFYIGSTTSKEMLRIYDKSAEYKCKHGSLVQCPYTRIDEYTGDTYVPNTWIRFELQLRKSSIIDQFLLQGISTNGIWRYICNEYAFTNREGEIFDAWKKVIKYGDENVIIQNTNFADSRTALQKAVEYLPRLTKTHAILCAHFGKYFIGNYTEELIIALQRSKHPDDMRRWADLYKAMTAEGNPEFLMKNECSGLLTFGEPFWKGEIRSPLDNMNKYLAPKEVKGEKDLI